MNPPILGTDHIAEKKDSKLPDEFADAWASVLIDIYQRLKKREDAKPKQDGEAK